MLLFIPIIEIAGYQLCWWHCWAVHLRPSPSVRALPCPKFRCQYVKCAPVCLADNVQSTARIPNGRSECERSGDRECPAHDVHMDAPAHKRFKSQSNLAIVQIDQIRMGGRKQQSQFFLTKFAPILIPVALAHPSRRAPSPLRAFHGAPHNIQWGGISKQCQNKN